MWRYDDFHILAQSHQEAQQPLYGELLKVAMQHLGNVRLLHTEQFCRLDLLKTPFLHQSVDLEDELCLNQMVSGIWQAKVRKHIAAADLVRGLESLCWPPICATYNA